jgi:hypothetical protein
MKVGPLPNSTGFPYNRAALIAQRDAALKAESSAAAAALQQQNQRLKQSKQPGPALIAPIILSPTMNALFISGTNVPIKLAPPKEWVDTQVGLDGNPVNNNRLYMVRLERKDAAGNWLPHTTLPVGSVYAESPTGYLGWGSGGSNGKSEAFMALPGTYRISAQVSAPQSTRWSESIEFVVTSPNKAVQKAPKMFGQ